MSLSALIFAVGNIAIFPSRAFIPAFLTALLLRFGHHLPIIGASVWAQSVIQVPTWFTSDPALVIMGILALLEVIATKSSDAREFLHEFDSYAKAAMAFLVTMGVLGAQDQNALNAIDPSLAANGTATASAAGAAATFAHFGLASAIAGLVFQMASMRGFVMGALHHADPHDDLHVQRLISWLEDLWTTFGLFLLILFPLLMLAIATGVSGGLFLLQRYLRHCEEKSKRACGACGHGNYPSALSCARCRAELLAPRAIGFLGTGTAEPSVFARDEHALELISVKRCPQCATRLEPRSVHQTCAACGLSLMSHPSTQERYLRHIDARAPRTLAICGALGLIPVIGIIPGIIYYRMRLVRPFRQYLPFGTGLLAKWAVMLLNLALILLQPIPGLGALLVVAMAYSNYWVYRGVYVNALVTTPGAQPRRELTSVA